MSEPALYAFLAIVAVSAVSLLGVFFLLLSVRALHSVVFFLVSLSVGALFGDALIHLIPESFAGDLPGPVVSLAVLAGILFFFTLEKFFHWRHAHSEEDLEGESAVHPIGPIVLVADAFHNFLDGIIIAVSFLVSVEVGIATTLAIILHEVPQEIADFGLLLHAGFSKGRALFFNFLSALAAGLGALLVFTLGFGVEAFIALALPFAAGGFLYIAGSDLVPELHKHTDVRSSLVQFLAIVLGFALMFGLLLVA